MARKRKLRDLSQDDTPNLAKLADITATFERLREVCEPFAEVLLHGKGRYLARFRGKRRRFQEPDKETDGRAVTALFLLGAIEGLEREIRDGTPETIAHAACRFEKCRLDHDMMSNFGKTTTILMADDSLRKRSYQERGKKEIPREVFDEIVNLCQAAEESRIARGGKQMRPGVQKICATVKTNYENKHRGETLPSARTMADAYRKSTEQIFHTLKRKLAVKPVSGDRVLQGTGRVLSETMRKWYLEFSRAVQKN